MTYKEILRISYDFMSIAGTANGYSANRNHLVANMKSIVEHWMVFLLPAGDPIHRIKIISNILQCFFIQIEFYIILIITKHHRMHQRMLLSQCNLCAATADVHRQGASFHDAIGVLAVRATSDAPMDSLVCVR